MRLKVFVPLVLVAIGMASGCTKTESSRKEQPKSVAEIAENGRPADAERGRRAGTDAVRMPGDAPWLREPFDQAFPHMRDAVDKDLQVLRVNLDDDADPEYFAWLRLDRLNGLGILFNTAGTSASTRPRSRSTRSASIRTAAR